MGVDTVKSRVCHCCGNIFENNGKCPQCGADAYQKPDSDTVRKVAVCFSNIWEVVALLRNPFFHVPLGWKI